MSGPKKKPYRVVQWATGNVGSRALRRVIEHPDLQLVGLWVHSASKAGKDAAELSGIKKPGSNEIQDTGIKATNSVDEILALKADCVLYMPHLLDYDEVCRILESGSNIITTRTEFQNPATMKPEIRERVEAACQKGGTSIHGTGSSPGFISEALPIVLCSIQRRLDCLTIYEYADNTTRNSPEMLFDIMGFGSSPDAGVNQGTLHHMKEAFGGTLKLVADAMGLEIDDIQVSGGLGVARKDKTIAAGLVPAGTVAATRTQVACMHKGKAVMKFIATWYVSDDVDTSDGEDWQFRESGWRVLVEGDCPMDIQITFPVAAENYADMTPGLTAHRPVNMMSYVCEAAPGIRTTVDLPQVIAKLG